MIRINLLPHRQEKRARRQRQMVGAAGMTTGLGLLIAVLGHTYFSSNVDDQQVRNAYLTTEIDELVKQIDTIKGMQEQTRDLLARKQVVESLQTNRAQSVHLLDQLARQLPEGMWLKTLKQTGDVVNITGYAQSNGRVSTLMRNFDSSHWLEKPELVEIKAATINNRKLSEFNLNVHTKRPIVEEPNPRSDPGAKVKDKTA